MLIGKGHHPGRAIGDGDGIGELAFTGRVQHGVHRRDVVPHPIGEASAVGDRDSSKVAHKIVVPRRRGADDLDAPGDGELGGDHPDRAGRTENEQCLAR